MSHFSVPTIDGARTSDEKDFLKEKDNIERSFSEPVSGGSVGAYQNGGKQKSTNGSALTDTPSATAPNSPILLVDFQSPHAGCCQV